MEWKDESDWQFPSPKRSFEYTSGGVSLPGVDDFEDYSGVSDGTMGPWIIDAEGIGEFQETGGISFSPTFEFDGEHQIDNGNIGSLMHREMYDNAQVVSYSASYKETVSSNGSHFRILDSEGRTIAVFGTGNPAPEILTGNGRVELDSSSDYYDQWNTFTLTFDWENAEFDVAFGNLFTNVIDSRESLSFVDADVAGLSREEVAVDRRELNGGSGVDVFVDEIGIPTTDEDVLKSTIKTSSLSTDELRVEVTLADYSFKGFEVKIVASPSNSDSESETRTLNESRKYEIEWGKEHEEYQVELSPDSESGGTINTVEKLSLRAPYVFDGSIVGREIFDVDKDWYSERFVGGRRS